VKGKILDGRINKMSQLALARRYRPRTFQSVIGQEVTLRALTSALDTQRLHHAYLFTGTRGVGKTTLARILAKCLNCEIAISSTPCGNCTSCRCIDEGRYNDLIEVDAASRTKVEDTRELLDNVQYLPTQGRFKIYLIDEVHMLSGHSFNALLKTLEEPPTHVKFILATTDPQKLPATILSRCLQFHLSRLPFSHIVSHLITVLNQETVSFEPKALEEIARAAEGSMRDALSLLDQALAYGQGHIHTVDVRILLGLTEKDRLIMLLSALLVGNATQVFKEINEIAKQVPDFSAVLIELITLVHHIAIAQKVPEALDDSILEREAILNLAKMVSPEEVQLYYQIALLGQRDLPYAPTAQMGFEMVLLRMLAFQPIQVEGQGNKPEGVNKHTAPNTKSLPQAPQPIITPTLMVTDKSESISEKNKDIGSFLEDSGMTPSPVIPQKLPENLQEIKQNTEEDWKRIVSELNLNGMTKELANHCVIVEWSDTAIHLIVDESQKPLLSKRNEERLQQALNQYVGKDIRLKMGAGQPTKSTPATLKKIDFNQAHQKAQNLIEADPNIQKLINHFGAQIESISAIDK
jgi:DNA polymerase-3 subunit gamma/tau